MNYQNPPPVNYGNQAPTGQYAPLSPWAYFGLQILFSIPVVGLIFLIVFSISSDNINRRNFARSYWCVLVIALIITGVVLLIMGITGGLAALTAALNK